MLTVEQIEQRILDGEIIDKTSLIYLSEFLKDQNNNNNKSKTLVKRMK